MIELVCLLVYNISVAYYDVYFGDHCVYDGWVRFMNPRVRNGN